MGGLRRCGGAPALVGVRSPCDAAALRLVRGELDEGWAWAGLRVFATPGHTPGHQSVLLTAEDDTVLFTGDLLVHTLQLLYPGLPYANESDPAQARTTRVGTLTELAGRPGPLLASAHLGEPFTPLPTR
jgi:glyoxylase-like metal-dependent hydrolase (beta-lactamase superfamily II)